MSAELASVKAITTGEALAGFSDSSIVLIAALFVIGDGLVHTGVARRLGDVGGVAGARGITSVKGVQVNRRKKQIGVILGLVAIACFVAAWPIYKWLTIKAASPKLVERTKALVEKNPQLQPEWDKAMQDGVLTWPEAKEIVEKAGEKVEPEQ